MHEPTRPGDRVDPETSDGRLLRGAKARRAITYHAVDIASLEGLTGLSLGRLATDLGLSKSGIQTLFRTKENLQLGTVECARERFTEAVIAPTVDAPRGAARLRALTRHWITYAATPLFAGGCFWAANLPDFDSRPGPVRDALIRQHRDWLALLRGELRHAVDADEVADLDTDLTAFQIDAVLTATNTALRLGDTRSATRARRIVDGLLSPPR